MLNFIATVIRFCYRVDLIGLILVLVVWCEILYFWPRLETMFLYKFHNLLLLYSKVIQRQ